MVVEKELNELLEEVFDGYESDTSETLATVDVDLEPSDVQLPSTDNVDTPTEQVSKGGVTPRRLRSGDRVRLDDNNDENVSEAVDSCKAENNAFHYPGHIPPLKYVSASSRSISSLRYAVLVYQCKLKLQHYI